MHTLDRERAVDAAAATPEARRRSEAAVLWSAIRADRRAHDERTARLRAMLLAVGGDAVA